MSRPNCCARLRLGRKAVISHTCSRIDLTVVATGGMSGATKFN